MVALLAAVPAAAQQRRPAPATGDATFNVSLNGVQVGREQVTLARDGSGWISTSSGTSRRADQPDHPPLRDEVHRRLAAARAEDRSDASKHRIALATSFCMTTAINEVSQNGISRLKGGSDHARTVVLPEQLLRELRSARRPPRSEPGRRRDLRLRRAPGRTEAQGAAIDHRADVDGPGQRGTPIGASMTR